MQQGVACPVNEPISLKELEKRVSRAEYPLVGEDLTSIVIPVYNQAEYLSACIQSIKENTDGAYEVILVDNGSDRKTQKVIKDSGFKVVVNDTNLGFPHAVNQGIVNSRGNRILLLNTDTIVTKGWLPEMVNCLKGDIGLVGPSTNYSTGPQCIRGLQKGQDFAKIMRGEGIDLTYQEALELGDKATQYYKGKVRQVDTLSGFCLLIDRRVISHIGYFDSKVFGLGSGEEMDFEDRARRAGFKMAWAKGSYVHHHGHKTLKGVYAKSGGMGKRGKDNHQKYLDRIKQRDSGKLDIVVPFFTGIPLIFPTWDRLGYTKQVLHNLLEKTPNIQVVIIDDGSIDGTIEWLELQNDPRIVGKIYRSERQGIDKNMDLFFSLTAGVEWVAKIDNDTMVPDRWLEDLITAAKRSNVDVIAPSHFKNVMAKRKYLADSKMVEDTGVYVNRHVGGLFALRRSWLDLVLRMGLTAYWEQYGKTPGGWTNLQETSPGIKAFYPKVYVTLLDIGEGKNDYPKYNSALTKERRIAYGRIPEEQ
jgi:GT2 family glycosyltransferase